MVVTSRAGESTRTLAIAIAVLATGCQDSSGVSTPSEAASSSEGVTAASSGSLPDRVPPEPFVLPEGCGDGVVVPGQYDCHYPVSLEYLKEAMGARDDPTKFMAWDMDGDGRDELLAQASVVGPVSRVLAPLRWNGESFDVGKPADGMVSLFYWTTRFDLDADGRRDLVKFTDNDIAHHLVVGPNFELEAERIPAAFELGNFGNAGPLDVDSDGRLEALLVRFPYTPEGPYPTRDFRLHHDIDGTWTPVGPTLYLPACQFAERYVWGDFNGDGHDDIAVLDHPTACDHPPTEYDPAWHAVAIFFSDPVSATVVPGPLIPVGDVVHEDLFMLDDFDGDGTLDFLVGTGTVAPPVMTGAALIRGSGDGTFAEGTPIELPGIPEWSIAGMVDLDGDGDLDWVMQGDVVVDDIFAAEPEITRVYSDVIGIDGAPWAAVRAFGDFNGDGVADYVASKRADNGKNERFAMISAP